MPHSPLDGYWHPVARAAAIGEQPVAVTLLDEPLVLFRADGEIVCFKDLCIHRGTALSRGTVEDGCLVCPYHGWQYASDGQCVRIPQQPADWAIPSRARAWTFHCRVQYGLVWVCLGEPRSPVAPFPEWDDEAFRRVECGPFTWHSSAARMIENFNDLGHFPFVHPGLIGDPQKPVVRPYEVTRHDNELRYEVHVDAVNPNKQFRIASLEEDETPLVHHRTRLAMPFTVHLEATFPNGGRRIVYCACSPVSAKECRIFTILARDFDFDVPDEEIRAWEARIIGQDQAMVETQRPEELPVDLSAEFHIRADRIAVEYRRWLGELGIERYEPSREAVV